MSTSLAAFVNSLRTAPDRAAKIRALMAACRCDPDHISVLHTTLDPLSDFGLKSVPRINDDEDDAPSSFTDDQFRDLVKRLMANEHDGRALVRDAAERADISDWNNGYRPLLLRDVGIDIPTFNLAIRRTGSDYATFRGPQLATKAAKPPKARWLVDTKLCGTRVLVFPRRACDPEIIDSNGVRLEGSLRTACAKIFERLPGAVVLDGVVASDRLTLFDIVPLTEFRSGVSTRNQADRHDILILLDGMVQDVRVLPKLSVDLATQEGWDRFTEFELAAREAGHPGVFAKNPDAVYRCGRNRHWLDVS